MSDLRAIDASAPKQKLDRSEAALIEIKQSDGRARAHMLDTRLAPLSAIVAIVLTGFAGLSTLMGAGLLFAGSTGWCGLALLLKQMPWNKPSLRLG